ncbi:ECs_2282 family putative zinc-binding protein [Serratia marcescens]
MAIKIKCPQCSGEICETLIEIHFLDELKYTTCALCGNKVSEDDIITQIQKYVLETFREISNKKK